MSRLLVISIIVGALFLIGCVDADQIISLADAKFGIQEAWNEWFQKDEDKAEKKFLSTIGNKEVWIDCVSKEPEGYGMYMYNCGFDRLSPYDGKVYKLPRNEYPNLKVWFARRSQYYGGDVLRPKYKPSSGYTEINAVADDRGWRFNFHIKVY